MRTKDFFLVLAIVVLIAGCAKTGTQFTAQDAWRSMQESQARLDEMRTNLAFIDDVMARCNLQMCLASLGLYAGDIDCISSVQRELHSAVESLIATYPNVEQSLNVLTDQCLKPAGPESAKIISEMSAEEFRAYRKNMFEAFRRAYYR